MDAAPATSRRAARSSWLVGCAAIAAASLLLGITVAFHGLMTISRPRNIVVLLTDRMAIDARPLDR